MLCLAVSLALREPFAESSLSIVEIQPFRVEFVLNEKYSCVRFTSGPVLIIALMLFQT